MARSGDGTSDVMVASAEDLPAEYTVAFFYRNAAQPGTALTDQTFSWNSSASNQGVAFSWDHTVAGFSQAWAHYDTGYKAAKYTSTLNADTWYHLAATYDGTNVKAWLNGATEATTAAGAPADAGSELISVLAGKGGTLNFDDGIIAELGIWDDDLTAAELISLGNGMSPLLIRPQNIIHYWPIIGKGSPEIDLIGGNNLTLTGTSNAAHPRVIYPRRKRTIFIPAAAGGGFQSAWARGSNVILGAGTP